MTERPVLCLVCMRDPRKVFTPGAECSRVDCPNRRHVMHVPGVGTGDECLGADESGGHGTYKTPTRGSRYDA